jgi:hypothetical protein
MWLSAKGLTLPQLIRRWRVAYGLLVVAVAFSFFLVQQSNRHACIDRVRQYDALHKVIVTAYTPQRPSPSLLKTFPQLAPFYTPGNRQYDEQIRASLARRDQIIAVLGDRPRC